MLSIEGAGASVSLGERFEPLLPQSPAIYLGAEYPSPKKVNLSNMEGLYKPQKVKGYLLVTKSTFLLSRKEAGSGTASSLPHCSCRRPEPPKYIAKFLHHFGSDNGLLTNLSSCSLTLLLIVMV